MRDRIATIIFILTCSCWAMAGEPVLRWGEKVFESSDAGFRWDGSYKGKLLESEVLVYVLQATQSDGGKADKNGNITLIR